ncbi:MAG: pyridoxal-phosphate dependent enzyme, partial [Rhodospirillales bacterium]|nr:pyridoxal-phosphate dependent enzyme [Rhodospirillales bacterium]
MDGDIQTMSGIAERVGRGRVYDNIAETIGNTPVVRLSKLAEKHAVQAEILAKMECFNPCSSVKDRSAFAMIEKMIEDGLIVEGTELVEATSGNNGIACAWICALKGISLTICMPEHMSIERRRILALFGANLILTPRAKGTKGAIDKADAIVANNPKARLLGQFSNPANPAMHCISTATELLNDTGGNVDVIVAGVGTGGTLMGLAMKFKEINPNVKIIAVEPASCPVLSQGKAGVHKIQGLSSG